MRVATGSLPSFSNAGLLATLVSACQICGGLIWVNSSAFAPSGYTNVALIASLCISVLVLSRLTIPNGVRVSLVLGVITVLLGVAVRGDITGVKQVSEIVSAVANGRPGGVAMPEEQVVGGARRSSASPARIDLRPGEGGDGGWAARLNDAARVQIDGGAPAEIHGNVTLEGGNIGNPRIGWAVTWAGVTLSCGRLSAEASRTDALTNQVVGTFKRSISRTAALQRPSCY
ncbi:MULTISPECIES: hypothetical protein [Sphingomonas]|uniref:Uncharacterized protein n=1 Tax=Sphingomonas leidyi TaxID=68569 RepID=A0A7X5UY70_9SPHN|nr:MULTISPECIES: hypothetical protein [Sphingomonas]MBN8810901.1 hypothetical protein [Sphingomonas sp.]NIJ64358.1 hypothetical protein [Sphingomonas leidyi]